MRDVRPEAVSGPEASTEDSQRHDHDAKHSLTIASVVPCSITIRLRYRSKVLAPYGQLSPKRGQPVIEKATSPSKVPS